MSIFKCKMCGGDLRLEPEAGIAVCEYCGTRQTLPRDGDSRSGDLFARAGDYRRSNEFDKAAALYEQLLSQRSDDAELYWLLVLCRYGIEYVEDPADHRRVPTVNRTQFVSILEDKDYRSALQYATPAQRRLYETEAREIDRIQRSILAISQREEPFDVFICYKETDDQGRRTMDSVLAMELYKELTRDGVKTFFSRITLQDKLGVAYEPYIFAALHSAKVMVVIGTRAEHFAAVWVKNEWGRYLALIRSGEKKVLIPAYRDMDPYLLPEEFRYLQAQDLSQVGAIQDLAFGVEKLLRTTRPTPMEERETAPTAPVQAQTQNSAVGGLLERAFLFLEDGQWDSADEYCEKVLDAEPKNARAYIGKLLAQEHLHSAKALADLPQPFEDNDLCRKAMRFGDESVRAELTGYNDAIRARQERERLEKLYTAVNETAAAAKTEADFKAAAQRFADLGTYKDAAQRSAQCLEQAEACRKDVIYNGAVRQMAGKTVPAYEKAIQQFELIPDWRDTAEQIETCRRGIRDIQAEEERRRLEKERKAEERRIAHLDGLYAAALSAMNNAGNEAACRAAASKFDALVGYRDAAQQRDKCLAMAEEQRRKAEERQKESVYQSAKKQMSKNTVTSLRRALTTLQPLTGWRDADALMEQCQARIDEIEAAAEEKRRQAAEKAAEKNAAEGGEKKSLRGMWIMMFLCAALLLGGIYYEATYTVSLPMSLDFQGSSHFEHISISQCTLDIKGESAVVHLAYKPLQEPLKYSTGTGDTGTLPAGSTEVDIICARHVFLREGYFHIYFNEPDKSIYAGADHLCVQVKEYMVRSVQKYLESGKAEEYVEELSFPMTANFELFSHDSSENILIDSCDCYVEGTDVVFHLQFQLPNGSMNYFAFSPPNGEEFNASGLLNEGETEAYIRIPAESLSKSSTEEMTLNVYGGSRDREFYALTNFMAIKQAVTDFLQTPVVATAQVGEVITFGSYEQDNDLTNGAEPIRWRVLAQESDRMLLITEDVLDYIRYDDESSARWDTSTLRQWLNGEFYEGAFSAEEREKILTTTITEEPNPITGLSAGSEDTKDNVFALSVQEAAAYFQDEIDRLALPSDYARETLIAECIAAHLDPPEDFGEKGVSGVDWWLRGIGEQGVNRNSGAYVWGEKIDYREAGGPMEPAGGFGANYLSYSKMGTRPCIWVRATTPAATATPDLSRLEVGDLFTMGAYEQDNDLTNGKEPIQWKVLEKKDGKLLVISDKALDSGMFGYSEGWGGYDQSEITYQDSAMRQWLNHYFVGTAFSLSEQQFIINTQLPDMPDGTTDRAFLLSKEEAETYFPDSESRRALNTDYSYPHYKLKMNRMGWGVDATETYASWVLRTSVDNKPGQLYYVLDWKTIYWTPGDISDGGWVSAYHSIRPAMWLRIGG